LDLDISFASNSFFPFLRHLTVGLAACVLATNLAQPMPNFAFGAPFTAAQQVSYSLT